MKYMVSLNPVPFELRNLLAQDLKEKIKTEKLEAKIRGPNVKDLIHGDLPSELLIVGTSSAFALIIPFIYDWLLKKRVKITRTIENGIITSIEISGYDTARVISVSRTQEEDYNEHYTEDYFQ